jgi:hypothetical protein
MLLEKLWLRDAKVSHDWRNNLMTIQGNIIVKIIIITKHLGSDIMQSKVLVCYDF